MENLADIRPLQQQGLQELEQAHQTFLQKGYQAGHPIKLMGAANVFLHLNRLDEARYLFNVLLENQPDAYGALQGLGIVQLYQKEYIEAMASFEAVLEVYPSDIPAGIIMEKQPSLVETRRWQYWLCRR